MKRIGWENGTLVSKGKVSIGGNIYEVEPEQYEGSTPLSAENLKKMEDNIEESINEVSKKIEVNSKIGQECQTNEFVEGKRVYVRRINVGSITNGEKQLSTTLIMSNITVIRIDGIASDNNNSALPVNFWNDFTRISAHIRSNGLLVVTTNLGDVIMPKCHVNIYYIKNT